MVFWIFWIFLDFLDIPDVQDFLESFLDFLESGRAGGHRSTPGAVSCIIYSPGSAKLPA